jgi:hypothetical protein
VISRVGSFRPDLGRSGNRKLAGEETELIGRIIKDHWKVLYLPDACVKHIVSHERLNKEYIYRIGRGLAATHVYLTSTKKFFNFVRWFLSDTWYMTRMLFKLVLALLQRKSLWYDDYMRFWMVGMRLILRLKVLIQGDVVYSR